MLRTETTNTIRSVDEILENLTKPLPLEIDNWINNALNRLFKI
jgi:hypothetical protein